MADTELLASLNDVNGWLTEDKLEATGANSAQAQIEAWRLIRGQLASSFTPVTLAGWVDPNSTPDLIRGIAGRLIAAYIYRAVYSEESDTVVPAYAQLLYNEAISMLADIRAGNLTVVDVNGNPIAGGAGFTNTDFYPNNSTTPPYFTMDQIFG